MANPSHPMLVKSADQRFVHIDRLIKRFDDVAAVDEVLDVTVDTMVIP